MNKVSLPRRTLVRINTIPLRQDIEKLAPGPRPLTPGLSPDPTTNRRLLTKGQALLVVGILALFASLNYIFEPTWEGVQVSIKAFVVYVISGVFMWFGLTAIRERKVAEAMNYRLSSSLPVTFYDYSTYLVREIDGGTLVVKFDRG